MEKQLTRGSLELIRSTARHIRFLAEHIGDDVLMQHIYDLEEMLRSSVETDFSRKPTLAMTPVDDEDSTCEITYEDAAALTEGL